MKVTEAEKLFLRAHEHNWDDGTRALEKILDDPACDRGAALLIYFRSSPAAYAGRAPAEIPKHARALARLTARAEERLRAGRDPEIVRFDPRDDVGTDHLAGEDAAAIPEALRRASGGEISGNDVALGRRGEGALAKAAAAGDVALVRELVAGGADVEKVLGGFSPLMSAAWKGQAAVVAVLIALGAKPARKVAGTTAGHKAIGAAYWTPGLPLGSITAVLEVLFAAGVKVDLLSDAGTLLAEAAQAGRADLVAWLLERRARPDIAAKKRGVLPVHRAAMSGSVATLRALEAGAADLRATDGDGRDALHYAVEFPGWNIIDRVDRSEMVETLLALGLSPDRPDHAGTTARSLAASNLRGNALGPTERVNLARLLHLEAT